MSRHLLRDVSVVLITFVYYSGRLIAVISPGFRNIVRALRLIHLSIYPLRRAQSSIAGQFHEYLRKISQQGASSGVINTSQGSCVPRFSYQ
jgi:hypothetical protein